MDLNTISKEEKNYVEFCDTLLSNWKENKITLEDNYGFDLNALPEPYLTFGNGNSKVCFLTTNPGQVQDFQKRNSNFSKDGESYANLSKRLPKRVDPITNKSYEGQKRVINMKKTANLLFPESKGFSQFEISPFHSKDWKIDIKRKFAKNVLKEENNLHTQYIHKITSILGDKNCICIQGGAPLLNRKDNSIDNLTEKELLNFNGNGIWRRLISKILGVKIEDWKLIVFGYGPSGIASQGAWYYKKDNVFKVILFTMGGNKMPKPEKMTKLFEILKSS